MCHFIILIKLDLDIIWKSFMKLTLNANIVLPQSQIFYVDLTWNEWVIIIIFHVFLGLISDSLGLEIINN